MKGNIKSLLVLLLLFCSILPSFACTSLIISGKKSADGRPLMLKHRDTGKLDNRVQWFRGPVYSFIGLVNSDTKGGEVWTGTNTSGFSIMNTASYNIKDDDVPAEKMDREGELMFKALGICASVSDFEKLLEEYERPMGVEANFGVIDANGGAAYFEVNNHSWVKYDVNEDPKGYRVVTNFSESGRYEDYMGYERYLTASAIMEEIDDSFGGGTLDITHRDLFWRLSRSYRHEFIGMDYLRDYKELKEKHGFNGILVDQDFIPRRSTSASIVIEGVAPGQNPMNTVMWTIIGYPASSVYLPLLVMDEDILPHFVKSQDGGNAEICDIALAAKNERIFRFNISNGRNYLDLDNVISMLTDCSALEYSMSLEWETLYSSWISGKKGNDEFKSDYATLMNSYFYDYKALFGQNE